MITIIFFFRKVGDRTGQITAQVYKIYHYIVYYIMITIISFFRKVGDRTGQITAQMNISDLRALLGIEDNSRET